MSKQEEYLFSDMFLDRERLVLQTEIFMPAFLGKIAYIFKNYGLEERVRAARGAGKQIRIVDIGCGEGLYLQELADWLQKRGWQ